MLDLLLTFNWKCSSSETMNMIPNINPHLPHWCSLPAMFILPIEKMSGVYQPTLWLLPDSLKPLNPETGLELALLTCHFHCTKSSINPRLLLTMKRIIFPCSFKWWRLVFIFIFLWSFQETCNRIKIRPLDSSHQLSQNSRAESELSLCFNHLIMLVFNNYYDT